MIPPAHSFLAHQGGWDEILLVVLPLVFIGGLLVLANRRVAAKLDEAKNSDANPVPEAGSSGAVD